MNCSAHGRLLAVYSGAVTAALLVAGLCAFAPAKKRASFEELDVQRLNLVEPDGTVRLILTDRARFPGAINRGKERPFPRSGAGLLFYNDEGTEAGGLTFAGKRDASGKAQSGGNFTFDQYEQDQVVQVSQFEGEQGREAGLRVFDRPEKPLDFDLIDRLRKMPEAARQAEQERLENGGAFGYQRLFVGKGADRSALVVLRDQQGRERLVMRVAPDGTPSLRFLDESGKVTSELPPAKTP